MQTDNPRRFIIAAPPSATAGIGDALRIAFTQPQGDAWSAKVGRLIERLDRVSIHSQLVNRRDE